MTPLQFQAGIPDRQSLTAVLIEFLERLVWHPFPQLHAAFQQEMQSQLKTIHGESKGKGSKKIPKASDELQFLMNFNSSITQAAAKAIEHLTDFVFITMGNSTLAQRDAYLSHLKNGIKSDAFAALRTTPLQIGTLFPDSIIKRAEEEISHYHSKGQSASYGRNKACYHPYERPDAKKSASRSECKQERPAWKNIGRWQFKRQRMLY